MVRRLERLAEEGAREVVLTGIHIGQWGRDLDGAPRLHHLLQSIARLRLPLRLRLSSIEPMELTDPLLDVLSDRSLFCPHLHVPLQSGCDAVLERMKRPYRMRHFTARIVEAARRLADLTLGLDLLTGFPQETDGEFEEGLNALTALPFVYLHVFPFSPRPGTPAAEMPDQVPAPVKQTRTRRLIELSNRRRIESARNQIGRTLNVLTERTPDPESGRLKGFSDTYHLVQIERDPALVPNRILPVRIHSIEPDSWRLTGRLQQGEP